MTHRHRCLACGERLKAYKHVCVCNPAEFEHGDCSNCGDEEVMLVKSEQEDEPLHYVCKECHLRGL